MIRWIKTGKTVHPDGSETITYRAENKPWLTIESRKKAIQRVRGKGEYLQPSYHVLEDGKEIKECPLWCLAKRYAEGA